MFRSVPTGRAKGKRHVKTESVLLIMKTPAFPETPCYTVPVTSWPDAGTWPWRAASQRGGGEYLNGGTQPPRQKEDEHEY